MAAPAAAAAAAARLATALSRVSAAGVGQAPDGSTPVVQSGLVPALHDYPRFGTPRDLALTPAYIAGTLSVAVPWLAVGLTCLILALGANFCCAPLRRRKGRARREEELEEGVKAAEKQKRDQEHHQMHDSREFERELEMTDEDEHDDDGQKHGRERGCWPARGRRQGISNGRGRATAHDVRPSSCTHEPPTASHHPWPLAHSAKADDDGDSRRVAGHSGHGGTRAFMPSTSAGKISGDSSVSAVEVSQLLWGVVLFNMSFVLVGLAFIANFAFRDGVVDVLDSIRYMKTRAAGPVVLAEFFISIVDRIAMSNSPVRDILSQLSESFRDLGKLRLELVAFTRSVQITLSKADSILRTVNRVGLIIFVVLVIFILLLLMGLFLLFLVQSGRSKKAGLARFLLLVPVTLSWLGAAVMTLAGVYAGDACVTLDGFQRLIIVQAGLSDATLTAGISADKNALFSNGIQCSLSIIDPNVLNAISPLLNLTTKGALATIDGALTLLFPGENTKGFGLYGSKVYEDIVRCVSVARFASILNSSACGKKGPILAIFVLWIGVVLLAVVLTTFFFIAQYSTFDTTRFYTPRIFNDSPQEFVERGNDPFEEFPAGHEKWKAELGGT